MSEVVFSCVIPGRVGILKNSKRILVNRSTGRRFIGSSQRANEWMKFAGQFIKQAMKMETIVDPVNLCVRFHLANRQHRHDLTNGIQSVEDLIQKCGVIKNDRQVVSLDGSRMIVPSTGDFIEIELKIAM